MKIKILNKNNNSVYEVDEAPVSTDTKNETLDNATVVISNVELGNRISLEPFDIVDVLDDNDVHIKYMCVDTYTEMELCVSPKIYRYEISLCSETKQLENTILPNLKISKVWGEVRSIYYYINQYMNEYCPKIKVENSSSYEYKSKFKWSSENLAIFTTVECPEMQWNTPTLREVLNDLMMVKDCIPILKDGELLFLDLTEVGRNVTNDGHINYVSRSQSSEDYISEIQTKLVNVTNKIDGVNNFVTLSEYCTFNVPENSATLTTENIVLKTRYPIYNIKSIKMKACIYGGAGPSAPKYGRWFEVDLTNMFDSGLNLVYEYKEWATKQLAYNELPPTLMSDWVKYQNWTLYYARGGNEISNFTNTTKYFWQTNYMIEELSKYIQAIKLGTASANVVIKAYDYLFKIEYETLEGCVFRASKGKSPSNERVIIDNQTNSYVDSYNQGFLEYQKANRLGNEQLQINARYNIGDTLMKIGDIYDDCVIYQCQYQYFKNHIEVNALATKDYILREYFTGVKSKIRSWRIADGSEALTRHDLDKYYGEFSWKRVNDENGLGTMIVNDVSTYFTSPLRSSEGLPLKYCYIRTKWVDYSNPSHPIENWYPSIDKYYTVDLMTRIVGNSLVFTFELYDNYMVGMGFSVNGGSTYAEGRYIAQSDIGYGSEGVYIAAAKLINGGVPMVPRRYVNDNGECDEIHIVYADNIKTIPVDDLEEPTDLEDCYEHEGGATTSNITENSQAFLYYCYSRPLAYEKNIKSETNNPPYDYEKLSNRIYHKKDSQEITNVSTQFEFCSDTNDICFTKEWLKRQSAVNLIEREPTFELIGYQLFPNQKFNFRRPDELPINYITTAGGEIEIAFSSVTNSNIKIELTTPDVFDTSEEASNFFGQRRNYVWYLRVLSDDGINDYPSNERPILLAFTNIPTRNIGVYQDRTSNKYRAYVSIELNILKSRNKNIYDNDNRYLIIGNI